MQKSKLGWCKMAASDIPGRSLANEKVYVKKIGWTKPDCILQKEYEDVQKFYEFGEIVGKGQFGWTSEVTCLRTKEKFACKSFLKGDLELPSHVAAVRQEVGVMNHLQGYEGMAKLERVFEDERYVHIVMELCEGADLFSSVAYGGQYSEQDAANAIRTILEIVADMHSMNVIHRDIRPDNFLLHKKDRGSKVKATNFGLSSFFEGNEVFRDINGSACYMAPEVIRGRYTYKADVWSCGVILFILLCGRPPYSGLTQETIRFRVLYGIPNYLRLSWLRLSSGAKRCIRRMLQKNASRRPSAREMLKDKWIMKNGTASSKPLNNAVVKRFKRFTAYNSLKKEVLRFVALNLPEVEIEGLRRMFCDIDADGNGKITISELEKGIKHLGAIMSESQLRTIMQAADVDQNGVIDYEEFLTATIHMNRARREETMFKAFKHFDTDDDGFITKEELASILEYNNDTKKVQEIIEQVDEDKDGRINFVEFKRMMQPSEEQSLS